MASDSELIQIVDAALLEATRKAADWLACRPGCFECCIGPFPIDQLDAQRLRRGLAELELTDPSRAAHVRQRARDAVDRLLREYPGDTLAHVLDEDSAAENEPCPALDPATGTCDLYPYRPITCRTFGPPVHFVGEALAVCELCFQGATEQEIQSCEVELDVDNPEPALAAEAERNPGAARDTIVAFALAPGGKL